ncbi:DNA-binding NarL/FixJ family response regulator [Streptomyces sp. 2132.2]|uniref:AAA family ATPase n=1 Tax=Streptomyces sp. 2132.2 TaxID=2485161 RepID=UPI000F4A8B8B|nr:AAA family ATPase [Streptomyces sp. 2132.2]ROQ93691.1 DNA-binding NarL/FixJ family response regulator [Streptomyces sp. 2132.2]
MTGPLLERDTTRAQLAAEAERARSGSGRLVLLQGASGTGLTSVLETAARDAEDMGLRVLWARCSPEDTGTPLSTVLQLLGPVPDFADLAAADDRGSAARQWRLLRAHAAEGPLLLAVDDVHLADAASRRWLREAVRRIDRLPVLIVVSERSQYDIEARPPGLAQSLPRSLVRTHTIEPLGDTAATELVRAAFPAAGPHWTAECVRAGAGSPMLLHALLDDLGGPRPPGPAAAVPPLPDTCAALYPGSYPAAVSWWLNSAGAATAEVARCLAALEEAWPRQTHETDGTREAEGSRTGRGAGVRVGTDVAGVLAEAAGADPARAAGWLTAMTRIGLLRPDPAGLPRFAHRLLRDAVLTGWPTSRREAAHRVAAETMLRRGERAEAVAAHLLRTRGVGLPWALRVLRDAATAAVHDARPGDAAGYLRRALDEPLSDERRQQLLTELGSLEYASADGAVAIARLAEAQHLPAAPRDRVRAAVALGTALVGRGEVTTALEVLRRTEDGLDGHPGLTRTVQTATALLADSDLATRQETYRRLCESGVHAPELVGTASRALLVRYEATAGLISAGEAMTRVRALLAQPSDPLAEPFLLGTAAAVAEWADELDEAERLVDRGLVGQHPALLHPMEHALLNTRADIAAARGDVARLIAVRDDGADIGARAHGGPSNRDAHVLMALVHTGRFMEAARLADAFDLSRAPESWELNRFLYARGVQRLAAGDPAGALHDFLECGRRQTAREVLSPVVTPWRTAVAQCRLALGGGQEALALATEELRLARVWNTPRTVGRALRVLGTATGGRRGLHLAEEAVEVLRDAPADAGMELVEALIAQGRQLLAAGERGQARDRLREAAALAERKGGLRLLTLAEQALREGGVRVPAAARTGSGALTGSERRIAELAAAGRTNTEIADLLHVARRTVETHLTSTYRKLDIRRRSELPATLSPARPRPSAAGNRPEGDRAP